MNVNKYKAEMRLNRGRLTEFDTQMEYIFDVASAAFSMHLLSHKDIGLEKAVYITDTLTSAEQVTLVNYISTNVPRPKINDIDMKVIRLVSDR